MGFSSITITNLAPIVFTCSHEQSRKLALKRRQLLHATFANLAKRKAQQSGFYDIKPTTNGAYRC